MTETELIGTKIEFMGRGRSNKDFTRITLKEWRTGDRAHIIKDMLDAEEYFMVRNTTILKKRRDLPEYGGNSTLSNAKIPSAFVRESVTEKSNYAMGKPFSISVESPLPDGTEDPQAAIYLDEWSKYLSPARRKTIKRIGKQGAINKGIGWAFVKIDQAGDLIIEHVDSEQIYPAWADKEHTILDAIVRDYKVIQYDADGNREEITKVEYWDKEIVERYIDKGNGTLEPDPDYPQPTGHMEHPVFGALEWSRVPFIFFKGNEEELPILNPIRQLVDSYDALQSKMVDAIADALDPVLALEGYSPELGDLIKQRAIMQNSRIVAIGTGGKAYYVQASPEIVAMETALKILEKNIRKAAQMIMSPDSDTTSDTSGVALEFRYQGLDTYTDGLEPEFEVFMTQQLKYFVDIWFNFRGIGTSEQWAKYNLIPTLNRDMLINESQYIEDTVKLMATGISQETIDNYNPAVESHEIEQQRRKQEEEAALSDMNTERELARLREENERLAREREETVNSQ